MLIGGKLVTKICLKITMIGSQYKLFKKNNINIVKSFHNDYNPYHIFYLLEIDS